MRKLPGILLFFLILTASTNSFSSQETHSFNSKVWIYTVKIIRGWKVLIEQNVESKTQDEISKQLEYSLSLVDTRVPMNHLPFLQMIPIFVSNESNYPFRENEFGSIVFHHSRKWLAENNLNPNMAVAVHVINPKEELERHRSFDLAPLVMLHELAHGFHYYKLGSQYAPILNAYDNAKKKGLYLRVPSRSGDGSYVQAYAITNVSEYFAELTEAFFGMNDYFPHTPYELKLYDPVGFEAIKNAWK